MKITFKCYIETPTDAIIEEYTLDDSEMAEWCTLTDADRQKWKDEWAASVFLNSCAYGTDVIIEGDES